jgi:molecular chaperone DnaK (HSP70)
MGRIVGIDLGTTYSAVAIPEERAGDGFLTIKECPGYSIILDRFKRRITPSVVAEDKQGNIIVGYPAKGRAGLSPELIMFAKRAMGEDQTFQLAKQGALKPEEVSAHILRYLKQMAEERLGEPVDEAVITVPAYFSLRAKQMTEKAGEMAGLRVAQIAQEPVAAALMYCLNDPRDPLRVMTYDLGGGTFDISILEKRNGAISNDSIKAFDGDRFLGGYDFDKRLAFWLMDRLVAQGYDLRLNFDIPADKRIFAKLMVYAERAKIELSKQESYEFQEAMTGITDHIGLPVAIEGLEITRDQFESMIRKEVEYTFKLCHRARLDKARPPIERDQFDEILMVGGASRIPLIARRLEEEFERKPKLVEPDLCVALGAAIIASTKPKTFGRLKLDPIPAETDLPSLTVTGRVYVPTIGREAKVVIEVPVPPKKSKEELRDEYEQLLGKADEALQMASTSEKFGGARPSNSKTGCAMWRTCFTATRRSQQRYKTS